METLLYETTFSTTYHNHPSNAPKRLLRNQTSPPLTKHSPSGGIEDTATAANAAWKALAMTLRERIEDSKNGWLNGAAIFKLHDTFGMPFEFIRDECRKKGAHFDERGIRVELKARYGWSEARIESELREL